MDPIKHQTFRKYFTQITVKSADNKIPAYKIIALQDAVVQAKDVEVAAATNFKFSKTLEFTVHL